MQLQISFHVQKYLNYEPCESRIFLSIHRLHDECPCLCLSINPNNTSPPVDPLEQIWNDTLAPVLNTEPAGAVRSNGMQESTSSQYEAAGDLSYEEILEKVRTGQL